VESSRRSFFKNRLAPTSGSVTAVPFRHASPLFCGWVCFTPGIGLRDLDDAGFCFIACKPCGACSGIELDLGGAAVASLA
jgi:hypothetical protein